MNIYVTHNNIGAKMIEVKNLVKKYGSFCAVDDVSFTIKDGEIVGLLGPNGAGKSSTLNVITGYLSSNSGKIIIEGIDIDEKPSEAKKHIGFLPENPPLYTEMTVLEYLGFVYDLKGCTMNKSSHLKEVCEVVKLYDVRNKLISTLSKGYKQRVGIAGAIVGNPKIIILDEPTVGLDPVQIIEIRNLIRRLGKKHTVILSSHILAEVQAVCDRIIVMNEGKIVADEKISSIASPSNSTNAIKLTVAGPSKEVATILKAVPGVTRVSEVSRGAEASVFIVESANGVDVRKPIFNALAKKSYPIIGLESSGSELEDAFIKLITNK